MSDDEDLKAPRVAWPTIALAAGALAAFAGACVLVEAHPAIACAVATVACFAAFTPVHEAAHHNVARSRALNAMVGHACVVLLTGSLGAYRFLHSMHHKHTNDVDADPDRWSGGGPAVLLPLRFVTQDLAYIAFYLRRFFERPLAERVDFIASTAAYGAVAAAALATGHVVELLVVWIIPSRVALVLLAWSFDWLPHRPHHITAAVDRYRATTLHSGALLTVLMIGQNFHLLHHLFPGVPFYRYRRVWRARRGELLERGAVDRALAS